MARTGAPWTGYRRTLGCGHMDLVPTGGENPEHRIGGLASCWVCPPESTTPEGARIAPVRLVVDLATLLLDQPPDVEPATTPGRAR